MCIVGGDDRYSEVQSETSLFAEQWNKIVNCKSQLQESLSIYIDALYGYQLTEILPKVKAMRHFLLSLHTCICASAQGAHAKNPFMFSVPLRKAQEGDFRSMSLFSLLCHPWTKFSGQLHLGTPLLVLACAGLSVCLLVPGGKWLKGEGKSESCFTYSAVISSP